MYAKAALVAALASVAAAQDFTTPAGNVTVVTTTRVVSEYTTFCPAPTTFHFNGKQYSVTEATTLTITDCPCTIVEPCTETKPPVGPTEVPHPPPVGPVSPPPGPPGPPSPPATGTAPPPAPPAVTPVVPGVPTTTPVVGGGIESFQVSLSFAAAAAALAGYLTL